MKNWFHGSRGMRITGLSSVWLMVILPLAAPVTRTAWFAALAALGLLEGDINGLSGFGQQVIDDSPFASHAGSGGLGEEDGGSSSGCQLSFALSDFLDGEGFQLPNDLPHLTDDAHGLVSCSFIQLSMVIRVVFFSARVRFIRSRFSRRIAV